jgi:hypothetical protein
MATDDNPFAPPRAVDPVVGVKSGRVEDLKTVAVAQKTIIVCILLNILAVIARFFVPQEGLLLLVGALAVLFLVQTAAVMLLAMKVYSIGTGIIYGIGALIPCIGLVILLMVNGKANKILTQNGHHVGLFGADLSRF